MIKKYVIGIMTLGLIMTSCTKVIVEEVCKKRYVTSVKVLHVSDSDILDLLNGPDLRLDLTASSSNYWSYSSNLSENVNAYPVTIAFPKRVLLSEENWSFQLVDEDAVGEELICTGSFNPYDHGTNGVITITKEGIDVLELNYDEEE